MSQTNDPFAPPAPTQGQPQDSPVDLSGLDAEYEKAEAADTEELPDGKFQVKVHAVRLNKSQNGNPMLQYDLLVLSGTHTGRHLFKNSVLTPASMPFFKGDLKVMGIALPKLSELANHLNAMLDVALEVTKKTKGEYANIYFNKLLKVPSGEAPAESGPIPF